VHPLLARQLRRLGLDEAHAPDTAGWAAFLERMSEAYQQADQDRYLIERSLEISSREMRSLYEDLQRSSQSELARERDKLRDALTQLSQASSAAEAANRAKADFFANISHELRTPLNAIVGFARLMAKRGESSRDDPAAQREHMQHILSAAEHMLGLVNNLLDLRRAEVQRLSLSDIQPRRAIDEAVQVTRPLFVERQQEVTLVDCDELPRVLGAHRQLVQALVNLLGNASKFSPPSTPVRVIARSEPTALRIEVVDQGPGIAAEDQAKLFTHFGQVGKKPEHAKGSGIGLVLTRALLKQLGGAVGVESQVGAGSTFWLSLRRVVAPA
jgi:signal transduction histidine kinase